MKIFLSLLVVGELCKGKKFRPIILLVVAVQMDLLFQCLICAFGLSIAFWMISRGKMKLHIKSFLKDLKKCDTNSVLQSEVMCDGTPCFEKTWSMKSWVSCMEVMVS